MEAQRAVGRHPGERILIVKLSSIGDVIHALPIVRSIKEQRPGTHLGWVVRQRCADLLRDNPSLDALYVIPNRPRVSDLIALRSTLRTDQYDFALDLQGLFLSGVITRLSGAGERIGLDRNREGNALFLTDASVPGRDPRRHAMEILNGFMKALGLAPADLSQPISYLADAEASYADEVLSGTNSPRIALNVGASSPYKRWPLEHWIAAGKALSEGGFSLVLLAGKGESDDADALQEAIPDKRGVVNLGGKTTLRQLGSILSRCTVLVTGDTGPMHLAAAVGTRTVALFGPTHPMRTGPYGTDHAVLWKQIACSPCYRHPTCQGRVDCLRLIRPQEVVDAVLARVTNSVPANRGGLE